MQRQTIPIFVAFVGLSALFVPACDTASVDTVEPLPAVPPGIDLATLLTEVQPRAGEKAVLVNFWATWCPPCVAEMPELVQLYEDHKGGDVRVVAVSLDLARPMPNARVTDIDGVARFAKRKGFALPIVVYTGDASALEREFRLPSSIPTTIVFNKDGEAERLEGGGRRKHFDKLIARAIGE
jgi:thiol-disulfide isomerase/thioredoxin